MLRLKVKNVLWLNKLESHAWNELWTNITYLSTVSSFFVKNILLRTAHLIFRFGWFGLMVFNATFNNISVISWRSDLLVEETGGLHRPAASHWETLSHNVVLLVLSESRTHNISGDSNRLHRQFWIQLPCDHGHHGPFKLRGAIFHVISLKHSMFLTPHKKPIICFCTKPIVIFVFKFYHNFSWKTALSYWKFFATF